MAFLGLFGAHATGKTTALNRLIEKLPNIPGGHFTVVHVDNTAKEYRVDDGVYSELKPLGRSLWRAKAVDKGLLVRDAIADDSRLWIVDTFRFDTHQYIANAHKTYGGGAFCIFTITRHLERVMRNRCERKGKTFKASYWTAYKCIYEGMDRYVRQAKKYLDPYHVPYEIHEIGVDYSEWEEVDELLFDLASIPVADWYN